MVHLPMLCRRSFVTAITTVLVWCAGLAAARAEDTPSPALLVLHKGENAMAIIDPNTGAVLGRAPTGQDPHELAVSEDGTLAFASNYAGGKGGNSLSVIDIASRTERYHVELAPLARPHGLWVAGGKVYFTAEANLAIGRYDPSTNKVDWLLGTGQQRTHMIEVSRDEKTIFTSNVASDTISIIDRGGMGGPGGPPPGGGPGGFGGPPPGGGPGGPPPDGPGGPPPGGGPGGAGRPAVPAARLLAGPARSRRPGLEADDHPRRPGPRGLRRLARRQGALDSPYERQPDLRHRRGGQESCPHHRRRARAANRLRFTPDGKRALVSEIGGGDLIVLDVVNRSVIKRIKLGRGASGILIPPDGSRAFVAMTGENAVAVVDLKIADRDHPPQDGSGPRRDGLA